MIKKIRQFFRNRISENTHFQLFGEYYYRIPTEEKVVALTYDDGPLDPYTGQLISVLEKHKVQATFFFIGKRIECHTETAKLALKHGHQIANHSYSHPKFSRKSIKFTIDEINKTDQLIRDLGVNYEIVFRAPYGNRFLILPYVLKKLKKKQVLFDFFPNPRDWWGSKPEEVVYSILQQVRPGSIIVLHDGNTTAAPLVCDYTDLLITEMKKLGYRFLRVDELLSLNKA